MKITRQALRVNGMLVSLQGEGETDVIDAICLLLLPILEVWRGKPLTPSLLSKGINVTYGWNITDSVASVFLERLERDGQVERRGTGASSALISTPEETLEDEAREAPLSKSFELVMDLFEEFPLVRDDLLYSASSREENSERLVRYLISLDAYSSDELVDPVRSRRDRSGDPAIDDLLDQTVGLTREDVYLCARFISYLSEEHPQLIVTLGDVVGAGLLAELIEDFRKPTALVAESTTTIFLDAPLALSLVGASGYAAQTEARAIYDSLSSIGCRVQVLSASCDEAQRVLGAFLSTPKADRHGITQRAVIKKEVELDYITLLHRDFATALEKFGVHVRHIDLHQFPNSHQYFPHERVGDLVSKFNWQHMDAREHDAAAVALVMRLRQGRDHVDPLKNSYLFATSNSRLVATSTRYCVQEKLVRKREYGPTIDLRDLATVAWLRTGFSEGKKLPMSHLLAQSERVLRVRKDIVDRARVQVEKYSPEKKEQFELLLQDNRAVTHLSDRAVLRNWSDEDDQSEEILDGMLEAAISVATAEHAAAIKKKDADHREYKKEVQNKKAEIEKEKERVAGELEQKIQELHANNEKYRDGQAELARRDCLIITRALTRANRIVGALQAASGLLVFGLTASVLLSLVFPNPHLYVTWGARVFAVLSAMLTIMALYGKGFVGLNAIEERIARSLFISRCEAFGIQREDAESAVVPQRGRLRLK